MLSKFLRLSKTARRLRRFRKDQGGVAAVEFAMLLPLMVTLYIGCVEVSQAISVDRKVSLTARAVADLVAQGSNNLSSSDINDILAAAKAVVAPYPDSVLQVTVSSVQIDANKKATIEWSKSLNGTARSKGAPVTLDEGLLIPNSWLIWAEVSYVYKPTIGYVLTGDLVLTDQIYMRPRNQSGHVVYQGT
ncbi:MAG TPA: TadE/TadG family type IV pilus assembly protein [Xanthobacteraceae bacterium]|nr:TadE/TadG family type IV pilus assembly protein [Xanthobacteraceae bacterium]